MRLAQDTHVRADVVYRLFPVKVQAGLDFFLYFIFFFPGILALVWYGWEIAADSWRYKEVSFNSPASIQIYFFKTLIPVSGALLMIQGMAELVRCSRQCGQASGRNGLPTSRKQKTC
jgi:TRAP-type mannitol/chloroaromatic compound transport system permease small subunit